MNRILDANLNRAAEALRVLEEIARFFLDDAPLAARLKNARHEINAAQEHDYTALLDARDTEGDPGTRIPNPTARANTSAAVNTNTSLSPSPAADVLAPTFKANIKRLQQALRVLAEYTAARPANPLYERLRYDSYTLEKILWEKIRAKSRPAALANRRLYLITNSDAFCAPAAFLDAVDAALRGGVDIVQLREKNKPAREILALGAEVKRRCDTAGALFIVNDRADIAATLGAGGVHLGQDDLDVAAARKILGPAAVVGVSTHAPEDARRALTDGADYIGVGPVFTTPTKPGRPAAGLDYVRWVAENIPLPAYAIGGVDLQNANEVLAAGASRLAVVRAIINAPAPETAAAEFHKKIEEKGAAPK
jgi:thiamine-phosphate pyrophosphorylase